MLRKNKPGHRRIAPTKMVKINGCGRCICSSDSLSKKSLKKCRGFRNKYNYIDY